ncbi:glycoside hydrolase family 3 C-terminal domain-containing protein [Rhizomicrobium electricum]|uniref:Glycoside hydrolase family 3 protein n=1 Tax=Rhizomicrobium electricum TaxID=480070 RepID=A0ABN1EBB5_9PROT|nr:glycoside hydrolase family 3 C-terminal domain-containing protein [Rhizomicrobium electricum]NIJ48010.1 beta-glucosidase [Rhizomicrobium electricum]
MRRSKFAALLLATCALTVGAAGAGPVAREGVRAEAEARAGAVVAKMTVDEKVGQLVNTAPAIPRLGIPAYNWWTESLHGAIGTVPATNFPEPIGLAATFDASFVKSVAAVVSEENRALHALARRTGHLGKIGTGLDTWSPNINLFRDPRWGRGQETYGEDPYLTARMGVAYVQGMQGPDADLPDVIATPKHFAVHSGPESTRHQANVFVSQHDIEDTYLPAFRAAVVEGGAQSIMCAYNRVDGQPACASDLLMKDRLRGAWGFKGYVVSDCDAVKDIADTHKYAPDQAAAVAAALKAGVDNECNNGTLVGVPGLPERYKEALARGYISIADIDRALVRLFAARYRTGDLAGLDRGPARSEPGILTPAHAAMALTAAEKSLVLLKNDKALPLAPNARIAVIGPLADSTRVLRGNYSAQQTGTPVSVLDGLKRAMPQAAITHVPFGRSLTDGDSVPQSALQTPDGKPGLKAEYFNAKHPPVVKATEWNGILDDFRTTPYAAKPVVTRIEPNVAARGYDTKAIAEHHRVVWTGYLVPPESGLYRIGLNGMLTNATLDGKEIGRIDRSGYGKLPKYVEMKLEKGKRYALRITAEAHGMSNADLLWKRISDQPDAELQTAAANADVIVAVVGLTSDLEGEEMDVHVEGFSGGDKTSLELPADQRAMLERAKATGKPLVVVAMNGSPIALQWAKANAAAIVEAWYSGEAGGQAIANVLSGKTNPAGRLPLTFYATVNDLPSFDDYSMKGRTYRYFQGTPVYPFGYGLSYTTFSYGPVTVTPVNGAPEEGLKVTAEVANTGGRDGEEVAELYLTPPAFEGAPKLALRGFERIGLKAGERKTVSFVLSPRDLSFVAADGTRQVVAGRYTVDVGSGQPAADVPHQSASFATTKAVKLPE